MILNFHKNDNTDMKHFFLHLADGAGAGTVLISGYLNITELIKGFDYNEWVIGLTSFFGLIWIFLKIINQRLSNKKLRLENKNLQKK